MDTTVYNQKGDSVGKIKIPESVFGVKWNSDMVHQVVTSMTSSARRNTAHTKTRGEVRGGGKKPWKQKGTGQARHGSTRSPIWVGGGVAHGPRNDKNYDRKVNRKMKTKALFAILSRKLSDGEIIFIDAITMGEAKTKNAINIISNLRKIEGFDKIFNKKKNSALITLGEKDDSITRSFKNIGNVSVDEIRNINPVTLLNYKALIILNPEASLRLLESRLKQKATGDAEGVIKKKFTAKKKGATTKKKVVAAKPKSL
jgi:large subunit ribosomal protein L4